MALYEGERTGSGAALDRAMPDALAESLGARARLVHQSGARRSARARTTHHRVVRAVNGSGCAVVCLAGRTTTSGRACAAACRAVPHRLERAVHEQRRSCAPREAINEVLVSGLGAPRSVALTALLYEHYRPGVHADSRRASPTIRNCGCVGGGCRRHRPRSRSTPCGRGVLPRGRSDVRRSAGAGRAQHRGPPRPRLPDSEIHELREKGTIA